MKRAMIAAAALTVLGVIFVGSAGAQTTAPSLPGGWQDLPIDGLASLAESLLVGCDHASARQVVQHAGTKATAVHEVRRISGAAYATMLDAADSWMAPILLGPCQLDMAQCDANNTGWAVGVLQNAGDSNEARVLLDSRKAQIATVRDLRSLVGGFRQGLPGYGAASSRWCAGVLLERCASDSNVCNLTDAAWASWMLIEGGSRAQGRQILQGIEGGQRSAASDPEELVKGYAYASRAYSHQTLTISGNAKNVRTSGYTYPNGTSLSYGYPASGIGAALNRVMTIGSYVEANYLGAGTVVRQCYDTSGFRVGFTYGSGGNYSALDRFGRVINQNWLLEWRGYDQELDHFTCRYDRNSNRVYRKNEMASAFSELYHGNNAPLGGEYDGLDRLTSFRRGSFAADGNSVTGGWKGGQEFDLDAVGNWRSFKDSVTGDGNWNVDQARVHDLANELISTAGAGVSKWCDPNYDAAGNMTSGPDPRSNALAADPNFRQFYFYDAWNRMVLAARDTNANGQYDSGTDATIALYYYDGENRRVAKAVANGANWDRTDFYHNDSWQVLEERKAAGQADANTVATTYKYHYVWDLRYIDSPVCRIDPALGAPLYYLNDFNFNVTALVFGGAVVERYVYDPYGKVTFCDASWTPRTPNQSAYANEILYCGYRYEPETGLYHVNNRYLHPGMGRWNRTDPSRFVDGMNLYQYVRSAPTKYVDPSGLWGKDFHHDLVVELANKAHIACAEMLGILANSPDEDESDPPSSFFKALSLKASAVLVRASGPSPFAGPYAYDSTESGSMLPRMNDHREEEARAMEAEAKRLIAQAAEWHFPTDPDGEVRPDSKPANVKVDKGITDCDFRLFARGLHVLQDSWSHRGTPYWDGLGHARGLIEDPSPYAGRFAPLNKFIVHDLRAAWSPSADKVADWPGSARGAAIATYAKIREFKKRCPCACPGKIDFQLVPLTITLTTVPTSSGPAEAEDAVDDWLERTRLPGNDPVAPTDPTK